MKRHHKDPQHSQTWHQLKPVDPNTVTEWVFRFGALFLHAAVIALGFVAGLGLLMAFF